MHSAGEVADGTLPSDGEAEALARTFVGEGEMAARCRALDWAATPLGPVSGWPAALRTAVRLMMATPIATSLWCGRGYTLLYNDAYRRILGVKHPAALGRSGADVWEELWPALQAQFEQVRAGGPPVYADEARLVMARLEDGREDAWFTYSLSALTDDDGECVAIYNVAVETTERVRAREALTAERARLLEAFRLVPAFISVVRGPDHVLEFANDAYYEFVGRRDILGMPVWEALPDARAQGFEELLDGVKVSGVPVSGREAPVRLVRTPGAEPEERYVNFVYHPLTDADGTRSGVMGYGSDVTDYVVARREVERLLAAERAARARAEESERRFRATADSAPVLMWTSGTDARCDWFNASWLAFTGRAMVEEVGDGWIDRVHPDDRDRCLGRYLDAFHARQPLTSEYRVRRHDGEYRWLLDSGVPRFLEPASDGGDPTFVGYIGSCVDVTDQRRAREAAEAANAALQDQALELELTNQQLQEGAAELEAQTEALQATAQQLEERTAEAEAARARVLGTLESMADAYFALDAEFRIVAVNAAMERGSGLPREALLGRVFWELFPGTVDNEFEYHFRRAATERVEAHFTHDYADARLDLVVEDHVYPTEGGGIAVFWRDVTVRVRAEAALRESEARYRALFESIDSGFCVIDMLFDADGAPVDYRFMEANPAFVQQTGLADAVGRTARELVPDLEAHWIEMYGRVATTGEPVRFENGSDAMGRWFDVYAFRLGAPEDARVALLFTEVSIARIAARERERLIGALEVERARLAEVFQRAPSFIVAFRGPEQRYEFVNEAYYQLVGHGRDLIGKPLFEGLPELREQGFKPLLDHVLETGEPWVGRETPAVLQRTPGAPPETRYLDMVFQALVEADGTRTGVVAHGSDVTEQVLARREVERLLAESEEARQRTEAVLGSIADAFYLLDREWRFTYVNDAAEPLLQTTRDALLGRTLWEAFPGVAGSPFEGPYRESMTEGRDTSVEAYFEPLGTWFDVRSYPWSGGLMVHFRDIGERKRAEAERERLLADAEAARREAEGANQAKSEFLAVMSHELRTPLNAIGGYAELMELGLHGPVTAEQRTALERIQRSQRHLLGLINGVLNYTRVEAGAVHYDMEDVPLDEALATCEALTAPQVRGRRLAFTYRHCEPAVTAWADREKLQQVVLNLLTNAVKFTDAGGRVELACSATSSEVRITVTDNGRGIPADQLARVFEPFVQIDTRLTRTQDGVGLGLAISRDLARGMGGDLTAESTVGEGSTFTLVLPRRGRS